MTAPPFSNLIDENGVTRLRVTGAGGASPAAAGNYASNPVTIADGSFALIPFASLVTGTELLDRSDPTQATLLASGIYLIAVLIVVDDGPVTAGGQIVVSTVVGTGQNAGSVTAITGGNSSACGVTACGPGNAGDLVVVAVENYDGASAHDFSLSLANLVQIA